MNERKKKSTLDILSMLSEEVPDQAVPEEDEDEEEEEDVEVMQRPPMPKRGGMR